MQGTGLIAVHGIGTAISEAFAESQTRDDDPIDYSEDLGVAGY
jgi:hypothetical protein